MSGPTDKPSGPRPNPSAAGIAARKQLGPTVRVIAPIESLLDDGRNLIKSGLDHLKLRAGQFSPNDVRTLESLIRSAKLLQELDAAVKAELAPKLAKATEEQLQELADKLGVGDTNEGSD